MYGKSLYKSPINKCVSEDSIFGSTFFLLYTVMITNPVDSIFRNVLHTEGVTTYPKVLWMYDLWHSLLKLNLTSRH